MAGARYERQLVNTLTDLGWGALRTPSSGSATDRDLPDVLTGHPHPDATDVATSEAYAIEVKATSQTTAYAGRDELDALTRFANRFGAQPLVAAYFKQQGGSRSRYYLVPPEQLRMTDQHGGVPRATATDRARFIAYPSTDTKDAAFEDDPTVDAQPVPDGGSRRYRKAPTVNDDGTISLWGVGPTCPGCGGPTHAVTAAEDAERPWWCGECNVRFDDDAKYGNEVYFPAGNDPHSRSEEGER